MTETVPERAVRVDTTQPGAPVRAPAAPRPVIGGARTELRVGGMTCGACAARIERIVGRVDGLHADVNYATGIATVGHPRDVDTAVLVALVEDAGYTAEPILSSAGTASRTRPFTVAVTMAVAASLVVAGILVVLVWALSVAFPAAAWAIVALVGAVGAAVWRSGSVRSTPAPHVRAGIDVVVDVVVDTADTADVLAVAGAVAVRCAGPVARAVADRAAAQVPFWPAVYDVVEHDGLGITAETGARSVVLGSPAVVGDLVGELPPVLAGAAADAVAMHRVAVVVAWDGIARAVLSVGAPGAQRRS